MNTINTQTEAEECVKQLCNYLSRNTNTTYAADLLSKTLAEKFAKEILDAACVDGQGGCQLCKA